MPEEKPQPHVKSGWRTSEFWLLVGVNILGWFVVESGLCEQATGSFKTVCGLGAYGLSALSALGYGYLRVKAKTAGNNK